MERDVCAVAVVGKSVMIDQKQRIKEAWEQRRLSFRYHFGAHGKPPIDLRGNLADARKVKSTPVG